MTESKNSESLIKVGSQNEMFDQNQATVSSDKMSECLVCLETFMEGSRLEEHLHVVHNIKNYLFCKRCNENFPTDSERLNHICKPMKSPPTGEHSAKSQQPEFIKEESLSCDGSIAFFAETVLESPANPPPLKNDGLTVLDKKEPGTKAGIKEATENPSNTEGSDGIECETCGKMLRSHASLALHLKSHFRDQKYYCQYCEKYFSVSEYYARHIRAHPKDKPHYCDICNKWFSQQITLFLHKRIHTGERPYQCTYCKKSFRILDFLKKHIRCHTGERPYKCRICNKSFTQKSSVNIHTRNAHKFEAQIEGQGEQVGLQSPPKTSTGEICLESI